MTHTPGEWQDGIPSDAIVVGVPMNTNLATDKLEEIGYYGGLVIAESVMPQNKPLIKAAPDLLVALKLARDLLSKKLGFEDDLVPIMRIDKAIAKAEAEG